MNRQQLRAKLYGAGSVGEIFQILLNNYNLNIHLSPIIKAAFVEGILKGFDLIKPPPK